ncbi:MAG: hypothetical protein C4346_18120, partial [Chloroflexota bacterium]
MISLSRWQRAGSNTCQDGNGAAAMIGAPETDPEPSPADPSRVTWMIAPSSGALPLGTPRQRRRIAPARSPDLPVSDSAVPEQEARSAPGPTRTTADHLAQETTVLLVDEDQPRRELLAVVLQGEGYRVEQVSSVQEALQRMRRHRPALVIIDERLIHQAGHVNAELLQRWELPMVILDPRDVRHPLVPHAKAIGSPPDIAQLLDVVAGLTG